MIIRIVVLVFSFFFLSFFEMSAMDTWCELSNTEHQEIDIKTKELEEEDWLEVDCSPEAEKFELMDLMLSLMKGQLPKNENVILDNGNVVPIREMLCRLEIRDTIKSDNMLFNLVKYEFERFIKGSDLAQDSERQELNSQTRRETGILEKLLELKKNNRNNSTYSKEELLKNREQMMESLQKQPGKDNRSFLVQPAKKISPMAQLKKIYDEIDFL